MRTTWFPLCLGQEEVDQGVRAAMQKFCVNNNLNISTSSRAAEGACRGLIQGNWSAYMHVRTWPSGSAVDYEYDAFDFAQCIRWSRRGELELFWRWREYDWKHSPGCRWARESLIGTKGTVAQLGVEEVLILLLLVKEKRRYNRD